MKTIFAACLLVDDFEESLKFYTKTIGLEINSINSKFADFKIDGTSLAIFEKDEAEAMFNKRYMGSSGGIVLAYEVDSLKVEVARLMKNGVDFIEEPKTTPWGQRVAYFRDPDKNIWEVSEK